ncbi:MAG: hypothetical protein V2B15_08645 [Bacteroidota bacterium]
MDLKTKLGAYNDLKDQRFLDVDLKLLKKFNPKHKVFETPNPTPAQLAEALYDLLDDVSPADILKERNAHLEKLKKTEELKAGTAQLVEKEEILQLIEDGDLEEAVKRGEALPEDHLYLTEIKAAVEAALSSQLTKLQGDVIAALSDKKEEKPEDTAPNAEADVPAEDTKAEETQAAAAKKKTPAAGSKKKGSTQGSGGTS